MIKIENIDNGLVDKIILENRTDVLDYLMKENENVKLTDIGGKAYQVKLEKWNTVNVISFPVCFEEYPVMFHKGFAEHGAITKTILHYYPEQNMKLFNMLSMEIRNAI